MSSKRPSIAFWFRYSPADHTDLFHALPEIIERMDERADVHYFGIQNKRATPEKIAKHAKMHLLPLVIDRTSTVDKFAKYFLWLALMPFMGLRCRFTGIDAVYIDETIPLASGLARIFFGPRVGLTITDQWVEVFLAKPGWRAMVGNWVRSFDFHHWRRLPLIITHAKNTRDFLARNGVNPANVHPVYDPCDMTIYRPNDRAGARKRYGYTDEHVVLMHHGILHPNKGNDRILHSFARLRSRNPNLRFLLVGSGSELEPLRALAKELKIDDIVQFTGWLKELSEVNEAINAGDIGMVMRVGQQGDDFHLTGALVHSMACGLPILAAQLAGVAEVVEENVNGFMFPPDRMDLFEERLFQLAADPALRKRLGAAALDGARKHFDMNAITKEFADLLVNLASAKV